MSIAFYMDEHILSAITQGLRKRGVDVLTTQDDGRTGTKDSALLDRATQLRRVLFTNDTDFLREGARRQQSGEPFAGVVYARAIRVTIKQCIDNLELLAGACEPDELANRVQHLPL